MVMISTRKSCFEDDEDIVEVGISGNVMNSNRYGHLMMNRSCSGYSQRRRTSIRDLMSFSAPICYFDARLIDDHEPHFLDCCFLCKKRLGENRDIFMYRGDTPFCSEDCRQEQIDADIAKEKKWNLSASMKALRNKDQNRSSSSPPKAQNYPFRSGTVVAG